MISCITITQAGRERLVADAIADFAQQTWADRQLLIVHDGDAALHERLGALIADAGIHYEHCAPIRVHREAVGQSLGALRNVATAHALGDWICQWDDDDRYHPMRLQLQWQAALDEQAECCFLVDQLHWFCDDGRLYWDDWHGEPYPINFVQGTLLCKQSRMPRYPELRRGEDTGATWALLRASYEAPFAVARLRGAGWCYVYRYHGANAWEAEHHAAIAAAKHLSPAQLVGRQAALKKALSEYRPALPPLSMPVGAERWQF